MTKGGARGPPSRRRFEPIAGAGQPVEEDAPAELTAALIAFLEHQL